jgi:hypothetical protein
MFIYNLSQNALGEISLNFFLEILDGKGEHPTTENLEHYVLHARELMKTEESVSRDYRTLVVPF